MRKQKDIDNKNKEFAENLVNKLDYKELRVLSKLCVGTAQSVLATLGEPIDKVKYVREKDILEDRDRGYTVYNLSLNKILEASEDRIKELEED